MAAALLVIRAHVSVQSREVLLKSGKLLVRTPMINQSKGLASNARSAFRRSNVIARSPTLKERLLAPQKGTAAECLQKKPYFIPDWEDSNLNLQWRKQQLL